MNKNRYECQGNLTRDPEVRITAGGRKVVGLGVAVNERYKKGEEWLEKTMFLDWDAWDRTAERAELLKKGDRVSIAGPMRMDMWDDKNSGEKRSKAKFTAYELEQLVRAPKAEGGETAPPKETPLETGGEETDTLPF